jgi:hypothetical protein
MERDNCGCAVRAGGSSRRRIDGPALQLAAAAAATTMTMMIQGTATGGDEANCSDMPEISRTRPRDHGGTPVSRRVPRSRRRI